MVLFFVPPDGGVGLFVFLLIRPATLLLTMNAKHIKNPETKTKHFCYYLSNKLCTINDQSLTVNRFKSKARSHSLFNYHSLHKI